MNHRYLNPLKLELAKEEARLKGGDVHEIYLRMGGKAMEHEDAPIVEKKAPKPRSKKK